MSILQFIETENTDKIKQLRICIALWAYAYEFEDSPLVSDAIFDKVALEVEKDRFTETGNQKLDKFFAEQFNAHTGQWVRLHPELNKLRDLYNRVSRGRLS